MRHTSTPRDRWTTVITLVAGALLTVTGAAWGFGHAQASAPDEPTATAEPETVVAEDDTAPGDVDGGPPPATEDEPTDGLDPELLARFESARQEAAAEGVTMTITSGRRTAEEQQELADQAVTRYGTEDEAHRWVLPPEVSAHVTGTAIDVGPTEGALWLGQRQEDFGLCRTYLNEMWHFELVGAVGEPCPQPHEDASHGWS